MKHISIPACLTLLTLLSSMITGCHDHPTDSDNCRAITLTAGINDNFAPGTTEMAIPSSAFRQYMEAKYHTPFLEHRFDQTTIDRPVGHTFQLPSVDASHLAEIEKAILTTQVIPYGSNDVLKLLTTTSNG